MSGKKEEVSVQYVRPVYEEMSSVFGTIFGLLLIITGIVVHPLVDFLDHAKNTRIISFMYVLGGVLFILWAICLLIMHECKEKFKPKWWWSRIWLGILLTYVVATTLFLLVLLGEVL